MSATSEYTVQLNPGRSFISYSSQDQKVAAGIAAQFRSLDFDPWLATDSIGPGAQWRAEIERALNDCHLFVFLASQASATAHWQWEEFHKILRRRIASADAVPHICTILIGDLEPPFGLQSFQYLRITSAPTPEELEAVCTQIRQRVIAAAPIDAQGLLYWTRHIEGCGLRVLSDTLPYWLSASSVTPRIHGRATPRGREFGRIG